MKYRLDEDNIIIEGDCFIAETAVVIGKVKLENNTQFKRDGLDIILEKSITLKEALCGFEFNIELLNNKTYNIVNKDYIISPGYSKVIQNLGFIRNKSVGDLIIKFTIKFPTTISESTLEYLKNHL